MCVCERECVRERERECVCVRERERRRGESVCVRERRREGERESVCVREREGGKKESERVWQCPGSVLGPPHPIYGRETRHLWPAVSLGPLPSLCWGEGQWCITPS